MDLVRVRGIGVDAYAGKAECLSVMALFTAENAADMAKRAAKARQAAKERTAIAAISPEVETQDADNHRKLRLLRVRKQQGMLDWLIDSELGKGDECDAAKIDRMASAAVRLNELERQYSNRSLPPTLKAEAPRRKPTRSASFAPEPEPTAPQDIVSGPDSPGEVPL